MINRLTLDAKLSELNGLISVRAYRACVNVFFKKGQHHRTADSISLRDLARLDYKDFKALKNCGVVTLGEIEKLLSDLARLSGTGGGCLSG